MAGFVIEDKRKPKKITWQIHPVVYKVFNANGEGNYSNGIAPQLAVNEFVNLPLRSLGDADEVLLSSVLSKIYSKSANKEIDQENVKILFQSETSEAGFSRVKFK
jgi:uncharacterized phage-associated protein